MVDDWTLWQLIDSAFPGGAFGHSNGLESAAQHGWVKSSDEFEGFLRAALVQAGRGAAPVAVAVCREPGRFGELDAFSHAFLTNHVANRASRAQGRGLLAAAVRSFGTAELIALRDEAQASDAPRHLAPVFGAVLARLGSDDARCADAFLFCQLRSFLSAGVRLGIVGPIEAQAIQHRLAPHGRALAAKALAIPLEEVAQTSPLLDFVAAAHDRLYSRMFLS